MHQKLDCTNHQQPFCPQPWWTGVGRDPISTNVLGETTSSSSPSNNAADSLGTKTQKSQGSDGLDEGNDFNKKSEISVVSQSDGKYRQEKDHAESVMPQALGKHPSPSAQLELLGQSIAGASYQFSDPYYGGAIPAYGPQALVLSQYLGVLPARTVLPLEMAEEPVYVNAKQYHGILRRRQSRAKAELEKKQIKFRKPYLHESRHLHAMRRARGSGGRFLNTKKLDSTDGPDKGASSPGGTAPTHPFNSLYSESSNFSGNVPSSSGHMGVTGIQVQEMQQPQTYSRANGNRWYPQHQGFPFSAYHSLSGDRTEEGDNSGQQHQRLMANGAQRALTIK